MRHEPKKPTVTCRACEGEGIAGEYVPELCGEGEDQTCTACEGTGRVDLPCEYEVCPKCEGRGTQCKLGAMTGDEYREACYDDPDFPENYRGGMYDEPCSECRGLRVVLVPALHRCLPWQRDAWEYECQERRDAQRDYDMSY